jgi:uncharacterized protein DUF2652
MSQPNSFIFLPDISGFTEFVSNTEVEHSQHIIAELLELLIDNEKLGLTLAEIEGDALFYYKTESVPDPEALMQQVENMYVKFHSHLKLYESHRICNCGACSTANNLTLKFFAHAGPLDFIQIKDQRKPYGKEVITAHRLMKNTIPIDDYLLLSEGVYDYWDKGITTILPMQNSQSEYDLGVVKYQYYELTPLKKKAQITSFNKVKKPDTKPFFSTSITIEKSPMEIFELITNLDYRQEWNKGIDRFEYEKNRVNRAGTKHECLVNGSIVEFETVAEKSQNGKLVYGEVTNSVPFLKPFYNFFTIENHGADSKITAEAITENNSLFGFFIKPLFKRKLKPSFISALEDLKSFAESR